MKFVFALPPRQFRWSQALLDTRVKDVLVSYYYFGMDAGTLVYQKRIEGTGK